MTACTRAGVILMWFVALAANLIYLIASVIVQWSASDAYGDETTAENLDKVLGHSANSTLAFAFLIILVAVAFAFIWPRRRDEA